VANKALACAVVDDVRQSFDIHRITGDSAAAQRVLQVASAVLGPPSGASTKKMWRWERRGICVNVHREGRRTTTVWLTGGGITSTALVRLSMPICLVPGTPPKNSNCSAAIKAGPTWFTYVETDEELGALQDFLRTG
jgi:hypothetical protein